VDVFTEKHERWVYERDEAVALDVHVGFRTVQALFPKWFGDVDVLAATELGRLISMLGSWRNAWARETNTDGVMMIAWPLKDGTYTVGVWHQLHRGTLDALRGFLAPP